MSENKKIAGASPSSDSTSTSSVEEEQNLLARLRRIGHLKLKEHWIEGLRVLVLGQRVLVLGQRYSYFEVKSGTRAALERRDLVRTKSQEEMDEEQRAGMYWVPYEVTALGMDVVLAHFPDLDVESATRRAEARYALAWVDADNMHSLRILDSANEVDLMKAAERAGERDAVIEAKALIALIALVGAGNTDVDGETIDTCRLQVYYGPAVAKVPVIVSPRVQGRVRGDHRYRVGLDRRVEEILDGTGDLDD